MYLSRLILNHSRLATLWVSNPYRVHQRLMMALGNDPRPLFRIEFGERHTQILVQSSIEPNWGVAFGDFAVLERPPEHKSFSPSLSDETAYCFRLLANPTGKHTVNEGDGAHKTRRAILSREDQLQWLRRKLLASGAELLDCRVLPQGMIHSRKNPAKDEQQQTHYAVLYEGILRVKNGSQALEAVERGVGSAKAYGFGLLSLAPLHS